MPVAVALGADGQPLALRKNWKRAASLDAVAQFERRLDGKERNLFYRYQAAGISWPTCWPASCRTR